MQLWRLASPNAVRQTGRLKPGEELQYLNTISYSKRPRLSGEIASFGKLDSFPSAGHHWVPLSFERLAISLEGDLSEVCRNYPDVPCTG